jgi:hypothetical protein
MITRNGIGFSAHYRKHVREGICIEIGRKHPEYRGRLEFIPTGKII